MLIDTAQYYIFVVIPAYRLLKKFHWMPVLGPKPAFLSYHLMQTYNRRFKAIALARRAAGREGMFNDGRRIKAYFNLGFAPMQMVGRGLKLWLRAEAGLAWIRWKKLWSGDRPTTSPEAPVFTFPRSSTGISSMSFTMRGTLCGESRARQNSRTISGVMSGNATMAAATTSPRAPAGSP